jgi:hypothetical protein
MNRTLAALRGDPRVELVDDERALGHGYIVTLAPGWTLDIRDPHNGVYGEDTVAKAWETLKSAVPLLPPTYILTAPERLKDYALIIRCIHQRGDDQERCLKELGRRGLWLSADQKAQAGLQESIGDSKAPHAPAGDIGPP